MTKLSDSGVTTLTSLGGDELLYLVDDPTGTPASGKMGIDAALDAVAVPRTDQVNVYTSVQRFSSISGDSDTTALSIVGGSTGSDGGEIILYGSGHGTSPSDLRLKVDGTNTLAIQGDKVGINTTAPDATLKLEPATTTARGLRIDMPSTSTADCVLIEYNGTARANIQCESDRTDLEFDDFDNGTSWGPRITIGRNNNATTANQVPGGIKWKQGDGGTSWLYPDNSGVFRTQGSSPQSGNGWDSADVVGAQTSNEKFKTEIGPGATPLEALGYMRAAVANAREFVYSDGRFSGQVFDGVVVRNGNGLERYGTNPDAEHDGGKELNEINAIGDLMRVVVWQAEQIDELQRQIAELGAV